MRFEHIQVWSKPKIKNQLKCSFRDRNKKHRLIVMITRNDSILTTPKHYAEVLKIRHMQHVWGQIELPDLPETPT